MKRGLNILLLLLYMIAGVQAAYGEGSATVNVSVTVLANTCSVNKNQAISVEFGSVQVNQLAASTAIVPVTIACDSTPGGTVSMKIKGTASSFDSQALATNISGLGIKLESSKSSQNETLELNSYYDVAKDFGLTSKTGTFDLKALLISDGNTNLAGGEFSASATLVLQMS